MPASHYLEASKPHRSPENLLSSKCPMDDSVHVCLGLPSCAAPQLMHFIAVAKLTL